MSLSVFIFINDVHRNTKSGFLSRVRQWGLVQVSEQLRQCGEYGGRNSAVDFQIRRTQGATVTREQRRLHPHRVSGLEIRNQIVADVKRLSGSDSLERQCVTHPVENTGRRFGETLEIGKERQLRQETQLTQTRAAQGREQQGSHELSVGEHAHPHAKTTQASQGFVNARHGPHGVGTEFVLHGEAARRGQGPQPQHLPPQPLDPDFRVGVAPEPETAVLLSDPLLVSCVQLPAARQEAQGTPAETLPPRRVAAGPADEQCAVHVEQDRPHRQP